MAKVHIPVKKQSFGEEDNKKIEFYSRSELLTFMDCLEKDGNQKRLTFFRVLAYTGARKSEILALTWEDVDFANKKLNINKTLAIGEKGIIVNTPKTKSSKRIISLDERTIEILKHWRKEQRKLYFALGFNTSGKAQAVFTNKDNRYIRPNTVSAWMQNIVDKYDLNYIKIHGFRHTHCSLLFDSGASIQEVKERLGHANIETTMNIYAHVTEEKADSTADRFAQYMNM